MTQEVGATGVEIRPMGTRDLERVVAIERTSFSSPWDRATFRGLLGRDTLELVVLEVPGDGVIGYAILWCVLDQGELANIAVAESHRGRGFGTRLLEHVLSLARARGVRAVHLEVRDSNRGAIDLYRRLGFEETGRRRNYYQAPREDARTMVLHLA